MIRHAMEVRFDEATWMPVGYAYTLRGLWQEAEEQTRKKLGADPSRHADQDG